ncbi:MAG: ABC transporter ATP-binding protein [Chloroflexia bacterium]|nr:ABC transporter ATP-binding protein [Chloroflexia bacterium]
MTDALRLDAVTKRFGGEYAVRNVSLTIGPGEFTTILGPSGGGKSTTLRLIAGLDTPDGGTISIDGVDVTRFPPPRRDCALVFQHYALFPHLTVEENVGFGLVMKGVSRTDASLRVRRLLDLVKLPDQGPKRPYQLSGGQQQRVALARALAVEPAILLLDEPLGALDLSLRRQLQAELRAIQRETGRAFLHVTHDQGEALALSDRVAVMHEGGFAQIGTPEDIYERPANRFIAEFMGFGNILPVEPVPDGIQIAGASLAMPVAGPGPLVAAIRSEHVRLGNAGPGELALTGRVTGCTYAGTNWTLDVRLRDGTTIKATAERTLPIGMVVDLAVSPRHIVPLPA